MKQRLFSNLAQLGASFALLGALTTTGSAQSKTVANTFKDAVAIPRPIDRLNATASAQIDTYGELAYRTYRDAHATAVALKRAVDHLIAKPDATALGAARRAWLAARPSYGESEAFRF